MPPTTIPAGVTLTAASCQQLVSVPLITGMEDTWPQGHAVLRRNGVPAHTARQTQQRNRHQLGDHFWPKSWWPPTSPGCSPLDLAVWGALAPVVEATSAKSRSALEKRFKDSWDIVLTPDFVKKSCAAAAWERLHAVVEASVDHIEM